MSETDRKIHPITGGLWGLPLGIGMAVFAINARWVSLSISSLVILIVIGVVVGIIWSSFGPAKKPKGAQPAPAHEPDSEPTFVAAATEPDFAPGEGQIPEPPDDAGGGSTEPPAPPEPGPV